MSAVAYIYDGSLEGLLTAIFRAYEQHEQPEDIVRFEYAQLRLDQEVHEIETDLHCAARVRRGIVRACGQAVFEAVLTTSLSDDRQAANSIYRFVRYALAQNAAGSCAGCQRKARCGGVCTQSGGAAGNRALSAIAHPDVSGFHQLNRAVYNERHRIMQFLRFEHLQGDVWFARCNPNASVVPLVMDWFSARFNTQNFMIYDEVHKLAGVYEGATPAAAAPFVPLAAPAALAPSVAGASFIEGVGGREVSGEARRPRNKSAQSASWYLVKTDTLQVPAPAAEEAQMQAAWKSFYDHVAVEARYNPELRQQFMPQRLWRNITELT
ncbi:MAG: TIGR03915 family putative DNA repair protein [Raoultibacter sp.]